MTKLTSILLAALLAGGPATLGAQTNTDLTTDGGYPRLSLYGHITGSGWPYIATNGVLDDAALDAIARYDEVILDVNPITPYRPDLLAALRARHPDIRVLAYVLGQDIWAAADVDSLHHFPTRVRRLVRDLDGFLYNAVNGTLYPGSDINLAKRDASGRYIVAEGLAALMDTVIIQSHQWDGIFVDMLCDGIVWTQDATTRIDYAAAGYPTIEAFDAAWHVGADTLAHHLRRYAGWHSILVGNCATSVQQDIFNGWMRENFPFQNGGTWASNVLDPTHGYFADDRLHLHPTHDYIFSALSGDSTTWASSENVRRMRFGLGTASLGDGYGVFGPSDRNERTAPYHRWWYDEYAVDLATGHSVTDLAHTHWLGDPSGAWSQLIWSSRERDAITNGGFENNVTNGWSFHVLTPAVATFTRDGTTSGVGKASARIHITQAGAVDWQVNLDTANRWSVTAGTEYSATFWAKASSTRTITVVATLPEGGAAASGAVTLGTTWRQFQVVLVPSTSISTSLDFYLGAEMGDVWLDDIHFQSGVTSVYRRDFLNGIVLVNPSARSLTFGTEKTFRHLVGTLDPTTNDGSTAKRFTVRASDALFLLNAAPSTADASPGSAPSLVGALGPACPNPCPLGQSVRFHYAIAENGPMRLLVFDLLGRRVRTLEDGVRTAGEHDVVFDRRDDGGRPVPPGVYLTRLIGPGLERARTVVLLH